MPKLGESWCRSQKNLLLNASAKSKEPGRVGPVRGDTPRFCAMNRHANRVAPGESCPNPFFRIRYHLGTSETTGGFNNSRETPILKYEAGVSVVRRFEAVSKPKFSHSWWHRRPACAENKAFSLPPARRRCHDFGVLKLLLAEQIELSSMN